MTTATEISAALPNAARAVARIEALDWQEILRNLDEQGNAGLPNVPTSQECKALARLYPIIGRPRNTRRPSGEYAAWRQPTALPAHDWNCF